MLRIDPRSSFCRDENGAVAVIVALLLVVLLGFAALGVDVASLYRDRARLQSLSDLTAMGAMARPEDATARAEQGILRNGEAEGALKTLEVGRYLRNPAIAPADRFQALPQGSAGINGVRVVLQDAAPLHFAQIFTEQTHVDLTRTSVASRTGAASFSLDSHIANLGDGAINDILEQEFGINATVNAGNLQVLSDTNIDLGALLAALDVTSARNPAEVLNAVTTNAQLIQALQSVLPASQAGALDGLRGAVGNGTFAVSSLVGGIDTDLGLTATDFLSETNISALDVINSLVAVETAGRGLNLDLNVDVAGIITTETSLTAGKPAAQSGLIALGEEGVQLTRAAMRVRSQASAQPSLLDGLLGGIEIASIHLPIYAELAGSTATLDQIGCNVTSPQDVAARFLTASTPLHPLNGTSVAALYLGKLPENAGPVNPADLEFADLLDVNVVVELLLLPDIRIAGLTIQARSHVTVGESQADTVTFTHEDIANGITARTFGSGNLLSSAVGDLLSPANTELRIKPEQQGVVSGLAAPLVSTLLAILPNALLANLAAPVDGVLDATLSAAGLELGAGELTLTGHHCEPIRLVR